MFDMGNEELIEKNYKLILSIANDYVHKSRNPFSDLVQEGVIGLIKATYRYDLQKNIENYKEMHKKKIKL